MKISIQTQICENYGAHDWDGKGECPQHWKFKGGENYVVLNLTVEQVMRIKDKGIPTLKSLIEVNNSMFQEYVTDWAILDDDVVTCESWESPIVLSYEEGRWVARQTQENDGMFRDPIVRKHTFYVMNTGGEHSNFKTTWELSDGRMMSEQEVMSFFKLVA